MSAFKIVTGAAALGSMLMVLASERAHGEPPPIATPFQDRWEDALAALAATTHRPDPPVPPKPPAEPEPTLPKPAATALPLAQATEADLQQAREEEQRRYRIEHRDICASHGMHKQFYYRGRWLYWHCRR
jgi:hypothetical protein